MQEVLVMVVPPEESYMQLGGSKFPQGLRKCAKLFEGSESGKM